ncbi:MAG: OmpP1/FadL family transporter, partial [Candidatus Methylomirabilis sp.]
MGILQRIALVTTAVTVLACPSIAQAGANRILSQSASAAGQSAAFTAQADDPSAVYYNPAGMTQLRGVQVYMGTLLIGGSSSFRNSAGQTAKSSFDGSVASPPPSNFYITANLKDLGFTKLGDLTAGLAVLAPFGTLIRWPENGPFNGARTFAALELFDIKPTLAYKLNDQLSVGVGADIYTFFNFWGEGQLERDSVGPPLAPPGVRAELNGRDTTAGFNVSLMYTPFRNADGKPLANLGFVYRSQATFHNKGQFLVNGAVVADASQTIVLPQIYTGGIALWPVRDQDHEWKVEMDIDYTGWKSVRSLDYRLSNGMTLPAPQNWRNTYTVMIGTEYKWLKPQRLPEWELALRAGYWNSQTPIPDSSFNPEIPDSDNNSFSIGLGFLCKGRGQFLGLIECGKSGGGILRPKAIALDTAFQVLLYEPRTVAGNVNSTVNGNYNTTFYVGSINLR